MKRIIQFVGIALATGVAPWSGQTAEKPIAPQKKTALFDGRTFDGWVRYLRDGKGNVDETWTVQPEGVLACTGKPAGYIRTAKDYKDYKLHVEYRWTAKPGNNGILIHMIGEDRVWPKSLECQGGFGHNGDFFEIGGFEFNEHKAGGDRVQQRRVLKFAPPNEKPPGEWNVYEVWCGGDTVRPYVNGRLMNEATGCAPAAGKICLQSEGAPIEFRNIYLEPAGEKP